MPRNLAKVFVNGSGTGNGYSFRRMISDSSISASERSPGRSSVHSAPASSSIDTATQFRLCNAFEIAPAPFGAISFTSAPCASIIRSIAVPSSSSSAPIVCHQIGIWLRSIAFGLSPASSRNCVSRGPLASACDSEFAE